MDERGLVNSLILERGYRPGSMNGAEGSYARPAARVPGRRLVRALIPAHAGAKQPFGYWSRRRTAVGLASLVQLPPIAVLAMQSENRVHVMTSLTLSVALLAWMLTLIHSHTLRGWSVRLPAEAVADLLRIGIPLSILASLGTAHIGGNPWLVAGLQVATFCVLTAQALFWRGRPASWVRILGSPSHLGAAVSTFEQCMDLLGRNGTRFAPFRADKPEFEAWERRIDSWLERGETVIVLEPRLRPLARKMRACGDVIFAEDCILFTSLERPTGKVMNRVLGWTNRLMALWLLTCFWPVAVVMAVLIKLEDGGPVFFAQERVGLNGRRFTLYKFRSMRVDAPRYAVHPNGHDPRITRMGRIMRKTSLDEIPQLLNVFRGEMRLVGPRPEMPFIVEQYDGRQMQRLRVKPGITGLWQVSPHRNDPIHDHIEYDLAYIARRGPILDLALVIATIGLASGSGN